MSNPTEDQAQPAGHRRPWAVFDRDGRIRRVSMGRSERDAWTDFLSWPSPERISAAKAKGLRAVPVEVVECANV